MSILTTRALSNLSWGEERIANELLLKLGIRNSPRTVRKYMPKRPRGGPRHDQRWSTFVRNHAAAILACDFCVVVTAYKPDPRCSPPTEDRWLPAIFQPSMAYGPAGSLDRVGRRHPRQKPPTNR